MSLCESGQLIQSVDVLVKAQFRRSCCAFCAFARICLSPCCSQFLTAVVLFTDDPHRLKRAIKTQVRSQLISLSFHAVAWLIKSLTFECLRILEHIEIGSHRKEFFRALSTTEPLVTALVSTTCIQCLCSLMRTRPGVTADCWWDVVVLPYACFRVLQRASVALVGVDR